jgi:hypothetical protein
MALGYSKVVDSQPSAKTEAQRQRDASLHDPSRYADFSTRRAIA